MNKQKEAKNKEQTLQGLVTDLENLQALLNLIPLLSSSNPGKRKEYEKVLKRTARIEVKKEVKDINLRKNALIKLRDILQGHKGEEDLLVPGLVDQVTSLHIQFRPKQCLDCMCSEIGRGEPGEERQLCAACCDPCAGIV